MKIRTALISAAVLSATVFANQSYAAVHTYHLDTKLAGDGPVSASFASLAFDDQTHQFTLSVDESFSTVFGSGAFIGSMAMDYAGSVPSVGTVITGGGVNRVTVTNAGGPGGTFDFRYVFGNGSDRLKSGESVSWIAGTSPAFDLAIFKGASLHVQGIVNANSGWYVSAVPEPAGVLMLLAGLGMMGLAVSRR